MSASRTQLIHSLDATKRALRAEERRRRIAEAALAYLAGRLPNEAADEAMEHAYAYVDAQEAARYDNAGSMTS